MFSIARTFLIIFKDSVEEKTSRSLLAAIIVLCILYAVNLQEYLASVIMYRTFWSTPVSTMLMFIVMGTALARMPRLVHALFGIALIASVLMDYNNVRLVQQRNNPMNQLALERAGVNIGNRPEWINAVTQTTRFLEQNLRRDELFFALPYDPLYYYLTDKKSPTRQLIFFDHIHITPEQEKEIITELEKNKVNWVVISSRLKSSETGLGTFGEAYGPLIASYIYGHFMRVAQFGDWVHEGDRGWHHGTAIFQRIQ